MKNVFDLKAIKKQLKIAKKTPKRYIVENPHNYHVSVIDTQGIEGAKVVKHWNDKKHLSEAKKLCDDLNFNLLLKQLKEENS